jgi:cellulose synthase (UDP-forming)
VARPLPRSHDEILAMSDEAAAQARRDQDRRHLLEARLAVEDDQREHGARQHDPLSAVGRPAIDDREKVDS